MEGARAKILARESATLDKDANAVGFGRENDGVDIARQLQTWQIAGDPQLWKLILSPEFGDRIDLPPAHARTDRTDEEGPQRTDLEWAA